MSDDEGQSAARRVDEGAFADLVARHLRELRALCYRMAGSLHDADDLLQESLLRAWKGLPGFEQRADLRTWLYRVTTNACLDAMEKRSARVLPQALGPAALAGEPIGPPRLEPIWLEPCPPDLYAGAQPADAALSPEARYTQRESVTLAFVAALQLLPARQRAVLILRDVIGWQASECAALLEVSVAAVNSALQRARETLATQAGTLHAAPHALDDPETAALLSRYVRAWERADVDALVTLLHEDATLAMPPLPQWVAGAENIGASVQGMVFAPAGAGAFRLLPAEANGQPALAVWARDPQSGELRSMAVHVLELRGGRIGAIVAFLDPSLHPLFGLPSLLAE